MSFCNLVALHNLYNLLHVSIERHLEGSFKIVRAKMIKLVAWKRGINALASSWIPLLNLTIFLPPIL